jgi:hypothetical protein
MKDAYTLETEYAPSGRCLKRNHHVGAIVVIGLVLIVGMLTGRMSADASSPVWSLLKRVYGRIEIQKPAPRSERVRHISLVNRVGKSNHSLSGPF